MEEELVKKIQPHSVEAEQSVVGSMLMDKDAVITASEIIRGEDFYQYQYGVMFDAIVELHNEGRPIDLVTVQDRLKEKDVPPEVCSIEYIRELLLSVPTSANIRSYAEIVREKAILRRLIKISEEISQSCYLGKEPMEEILEKTEKSVFDLIKNGTGGDHVPIEKITLDVLTKIEEAYRNHASVTGLATGFTDLDYKTSGFQKSDFILIAARPSMGKTALVLNIAQFVAVRSKKKVAIFSLEMSKEQLVNRLLAMESGIDSQKLRTGSLADSDWDKLVESVGAIGDSGLMIDDTPGISISEMRSKCRKFALEGGGLDLIIVDYLQLMSSGRRSGSDNRQQEISDISRALKALAREMNCPVVSLSQLSRAVESRNDKRPMLSDLRESGAIEQDADVVMFIYRDDYYNKDSENKGIAEIIIAKQRNGPTGTVNLVWLPETTRFANAQQRAYNPED
ncbi:MAG: replicative DNA helicase [Verrucomicrobia bacterium]|nr:replicative DNA helicase [Lachnospiraceae bacterium]MBR4250268.1 replicative DNA helicase [Verrucomicrobiota bacterium]